MAVRKPPQHNNESQSELKESVRAPRALNIINARENNLKNISVEIPHDIVTVVTGLSGSGKSSLAFDTVYAEGQRRYIETFSPYTRQFFDKVKKPDVDAIHNVRPAIAIQQRTRVTSSRSTVGSMTNINDYLKVLWSNISHPSCPECEKLLTAWTPQTLSIHLNSFFKDSGKSALICAPVQMNPKYIDLELERLRTLGFTRIYNVQTNDVSLLDEIDFKKIKSTEAFIVLDRIKEGSINLKRLRNTIEQAFQLSSGKISIVSLGDDAHSTQHYYNYYFCENDNIKVQRPKSYLFSFNHPLGACEKCKGFGHILEISRKKCVPDPSLSIQDHAVQCWSGKSATYELKRLKKFCSTQNISIDAPWADLSLEQRESIFTHKSREYVGIIPWFKYIERKAYKMHIRVFLSRYREQVLCPECSGTRLKQDALAFLVDGISIADLWKMTIAELLDWLVTTNESIAKQKDLYIKLKDVFSNLISRVKYLVDLGLPYLSLERQARTLSGGETQRVNLATALGSELVSTHFILDEPSVGLHPRDSERLIKAVTDLSSKGNSLLVVEHDPDFIYAADNILEIGPSSGKAGGEVIFNGPPQKWKGITVTIDLASKRELSKKNLSIFRARSRNLKNLTFKIPLERFVCLSGVSGSGKSTLIHEIIEHAYRHKDYPEDVECEYDSVAGFEHFEDLIIIDQSPLAKSPRANIATYTKMWEEVRRSLAETDEAKTRSLTKSSFSFNVNAGRCPVCEGAGFIREDMQFLSDVYVPCETCLGKRFQQAVLEVHYRGKNVDDFLKMTVDDAMYFFSEAKIISRACENLSRLGLGHLTLGHPLSELSGGEAQRLKLVSFLDKSVDGRNLFIFDEPTTGLHVYDIQKLIDLFRLLVQKGNSVLCVEHNLSVIGSADWVIDLGPEGGAGGGELIAEGPPSHLMQNNLSLTGSYLKEYIKDAKQGFGKNKASSILKLTTPPDELKIIGATEHNLKDVSVSIPLNKMVALTGVSGSGKSTIAKDIIYAEGQRRYLDCLSPYARQFIKELKKPDFQSIHNVRPTICVYQHTFQPSQLSTIGTMSEIYNFLRLLFSKTGTQFCPEHPHVAISPLSAEEITRALKTLPGKQIRLLAPIIKLKKGNHTAVFARALQSEISEVRVDGQLAKPSAYSEGLVKSKVHSIDFVIGKFNPKNIDDELIADAVKLGLSIGGGTLIALSENSERIFSSERTCAICQKGFFKPDPEDLSFNSKRGACPTCEGYGMTEKGICSDCHGTRINSVGQNVRILGKNIAEASHLTPPELLSFLHKYKLEGSATELIEPIMKELVGKITSLIDLGLDYIKLDRDCSSLSGGELQRLRLATAMGSPLTGVMYIFDEPSAGLHPDDNAKVLEKIRLLSNSGNAVIVIEHDVQSILSCDHIIDVGPGAGSAGGEIVFNGSMKNFLTQCDTLSAQAVTLLPKIPLHSRETSKNSIVVKNASINNLKDISITIPMNQFIVVGGVSGAGKSSLVHKTIADIIENGKKKDRSYEYNGCRVSTSDEINKVYFIDQKPIGANSRSTPASYLGIWDDIRKLFAQTLEAKSNGWDASYFSYNTGKGRCSECKGYGLIKLEMNFLADAQIICEQCNGTRYNEETELVKYLGYTISDVLKLTFEEARQTFSNHRKIHHVLRNACDLGLNYLKLGQSSTTLSGGESQRLRLASELSGSQKDHVLYILDEPTIGLHRADVSKLIHCLRKLVDLGNSVIVIEHDLDMIIHADFMIEMGPGAGDAGGKIVAQGSLQEILRGKSRWGEMLRSLQTASI